jgi:hypothetical protein
LIINFDCRKTKGFLALANTIYQSIMNHSNNGRMNHSNHDAKDRVGLTTEGGQFSKELLMMKTRERPQDAPRSSAAAKATQKYPGLIKKLSPDYDNSIYDELRDSVSAVLAVSSKFHLKSSRSKGLVLVCGSNNEEAREAGFGASFVPLMTSDPHDVRSYTGNPLIPALAQYARFQLQPLDDDDEEEEDTAIQLPDLVLGLCCNNWGMYYGRNALIEAILEVMGPDHFANLSIHTAVYALDFNTRALSKILLDSPQRHQDADSEKAARELHAAAFQASAVKYNLGFDVIEKDTERFVGVSKSAFVQELSSAVAQAVERTMASDGKSVTRLMMDVMRHRCTIQNNLSSKRFRRAPSQNGISTACRELTALFAANFGSAEMSLAESTPGWKAYTTSMGGAAPALLGLFCHALDVMAGCVARSSKAQVSPDMAERLILTVLDREQRLMEYCFNQVYELMPSSTKPQMYLYRRLGDVSQFATMPCGAVEIGGNL